MGCCFDCVYCYINGSKYAKKTNSYYVKSNACDLVYNDAVEAINYDALYAIAKNQLKTRSESFYQRFSKAIEDLDNTIKADHKMSIKTFEELTDKPSMEKLYSNKIAKLEDFETYLDQLSKILNIEYTNKV